MQLGVPKVWNTPNPFDWMESISLQGKANFEHRVDQYQKAIVMTSTTKVSGGVRELRSGLTWTDLRASVSARLGIIEKELLKERSHGGDNQQSSRYRKHFFSRRGD